MIFHSHSPIANYTNGNCMHFLIVLYTLTQAIRHNHHNHHHMAGACLTAMLEHWLTQTDPLPSWYTLIEALRSPVLGREDIALKIETKLLSDHRLKVVPEQ